MVFASVRLSLVHRTAGIMNPLVSDYIFEMVPEVICSVFFFLFSCTLNGFHCSSELCVSACPWCCFALGFFLYRLAGARAYPSNGFRSLVCFLLPLLFFFFFVAKEKKKDIPGFLCSERGSERCDTPRNERWKFLIYWVPLFKGDHPDVVFDAELCTYRCILHVKSRSER